MCYEMLSRGDNKHTLNSYEIPYEVLIKFLILLVAGIHTCAVLAIIV